MVWRCQKERILGTNSATEKGQFYSSLNQQVCKLKMLKICFLRFKQIDKADDGKEVAQLFQAFDRESTGRIGPNELAEILSIMGKDFNSGKLILDI